MRLALILVLAVAGLAAGWRVFHAGVEWQQAWVVACVWASAGVGFYAGRRPR